ncbi:glycosyltransferase family 1 protein [Paramyrothecium foliicola]|nr:glycosyltransferase family 1 protein [Paramyrothecium foliicola]
MEKLPDRDVSDPPPPYTEVMLATTEELGTASDGRVNVDVNSRLAKTLSRFVPDFKLPADDAGEGSSRPSKGEPSYDGFAETLKKSAAWTVSLNIVVQVVGSRGDVQPFIALGNELQKQGHRVRIATHQTFESFVLSSGLEFYPIGGDPSELMAFMVKNPALIPSLKSIRAGDVQKKRKMIADILVGCWKSCIERDLQTGRPFVANAIIANPPSFAHIHCAQALNIPVHLVFTMPWSSTRSFSHPLANIQGLSLTAGSKEREIANWVSFAAVEWLTWQGLGDIINEWRATLQLEPVPFSEGPLLAETLKIPFTYCWSPALVPKPIDWPSHLDVCGFFFREAPKYDPPKELANFLSNGEPPVYIGFGSIVIEDPEAVTQIILDAVQEAGVRAIVSRGWSKLGGDRTSDDRVLYLGDCPHEWLFQQVSAVVHHGGAGTAACGLRFGRPTTVVPFFGDQPFWGEMVAAAGAGPSPIPYKQLTSQNLGDALKFCISQEAIEAAQKISEMMRNENGVVSAVESFHTHLPLANLRCSILDNQPAVWTYKTKGTKVLLSNMAAAILAEHCKIDPKKLHINESNPIMIENSRWDPVTSTVSATFGTFAGMASSSVDIVRKPVKGYQQARASKSAARNDTGSGTSSLHEFGEVAEVQPTADKKGEKSDAALAGTMALGAASGVGGFFHNFSKGFLLDLPLAMAEGMRNAPKLYGGEVREHGPVTDWKSGLTMSGKNLTYGIGEGFQGLVREPIEGARKGGVLGGIGGFGKGLLGFGTRVSSGGVGIVAYSGLGFYKSIMKATNTKVRKQVTAARWEEATHDYRAFGSSVSEPMVLQAWDAIMRTGVFAEA